MDIVMQINTGILLMYVESNYCALQLLPCINNVIKAISYLLDGYPLPGCSFSGRADSTISPLPNCLHGQRLGILYFGLQRVSIQRFDDASQLFIRKLYRSIIRLQ